MRNSLLLHLNLRKVYISLSYIFFLFISCYIISCTPKEDEDNELSFLELKEFSFDNSRYTIDKGDSLHVRASLIPITAANILKEEDVTLEVEDEEIIEVNIQSLAAGKLIINVKAKKEGTTNIKASIKKDSTKIAQVQIIVRDTAVPVIYIDLNHTELAILKGKTDKLRAKIIPNNATDKDILWSSSDETKATVNVSGTIMAKELGEATITAMSKSNQDITDTCKVRITQTTITLSHTELNIAEGKMASLIAIVNDPFNVIEDETILWSSSNEDIATVDAGVITAKDIGEVIITATVKGNKNTTATCKVKITQAIITLNHTQLTIAEGQKDVLTATISPADAIEDKTILWTSSDEDIATVDAGVITAKGIGEVIITATVKSNKNITATCKVKITQATIILNYTQLTIMQGKTDTLKATIDDPSNVIEDKTILWSSFSKDKATVDATGVVTALSVGEVVITATIKSHQNIIAICKVMVTQAIAGITLDHTQLTIAKGQKDVLTATISPTDATEDKTILWTSSDETKATVNSGVITAKDTGEVTITATVQGNTNMIATCKVMITQAITGISLDHTQLTIAKGQTDVLTATISPTDATEDKTILWTSSDETKATVDADGEITTLSVGEVIITATAQANENMIATCKVTITQAITGISLDHTQLTIAINKKDTLKATISPEDATEDKTIVWRSSDEAKATVDDGEITALDVGTVTIIATVKSNASIIATCDVTVVEPEAKITEFFFVKAINPSITYTKSDYTDTIHAIIDEANKIIIVKNAYLRTISSLTSLKPTFTLSDGATVEVNNILQTSEVTSVNFSFGIVNYVVKSADGAMEETYRVTIEQHNYAYIPDENFRAWLKTTYPLAVTTAKGDSLQTDHASVTGATVRIDVDNHQPSIVDMTGIEFFRGIEGLYCPRNAITSLDISQNTAITELYCNDNQLTSLDVSKNTALTTLRCEKNNIDTLDVHTNIALNHLQVHGNKLVYLDMRGVQGTNPTFTVTSTPTVQGENPINRLLAHENLPSYALNLNTLMDNVGDANILVSTYSYSNGVYTIECCDYNTRSGGSCTTPPTGGSGGTCP